MTPARPPSPPPVIDAGAARSSGIPAVDFTWRHRHWTVPVLLLPAVLLTGIVLAAFRQREATIIASVVAAIMMIVVAIYKWDRVSERVYAVASAVFAGGWLSVASYTGLTWIMFYVAAGLVVIWGGFWWQHKRPRPLAGDAKSVAEWDRWWRFHSHGWNLNGSSVAGITSRGVMETLHIQLWAGRQHFAHVRDIAAHIESALCGLVPPGGVRVSRDPDDASRAYVHLRREDPLSAAHSWHPGLAVMSVTEPASVGTDEGGEQCTAPLDGNWFIVGQTGSGKSNHLSVMLAAATGADDSVVWLIDRKGGRSARPWLPAIDWLATSQEEAELMLAVYVDEIRARAELAYDGSEHLEPSPQCPAIILVVDEAHEVTSVDAGTPNAAALLSSAASLGRAVLMYVWVATQHGTLGESVRTEQTRANLRNRICFRVAKAEHGQHALTDFMQLDASRLRQPGAFYMQLGPDARSAPGRGWLLDHPVARQVAERNGAMQRIPLALYAEGRQADYDARWDRLPPSFRQSSPQWQALHAPAPPPPPADESPAGKARRIVAEFASAHDPDPASATDDEVRSLLERNIARLAHDLAMAPDEGAAPKDLVKSSHLSRSYVNRLLSGLVDAGVAVQPGYGRYRSDCDAGEVFDAIQRIRAGEGALLPAG